MRIKKLIGKIHLWLGLTTGMVVIIISLSGAVYCFAPELQNLLQPYRTVREMDKDFLPPSEIKWIAENCLYGKTPQRIYYGSKSQSVMVLFSRKNEFDSSVFINPYSGEVLKVRNNDKDFFSLDLKVHRTLLIPYGHEIIRWSTMIFLLMMISGIMLWWPKNKRTAKHGFWVMWKASPKRLNYDLHKVLGFYATWIVIFTAVTGLMFAFESFADFTYKFTGIKHSIVQKKPPLSNAKFITNNLIAPIDLVWQMIEKDLHHKYATALFVLPKGKNDAMLLRVNPEKKTLYKTDFRYFDQYSAKEISGAYEWGAYKDAQTVADNIKRMNYDIHTGAILGLPGRFALFFAALVVATLPITGFYIWWGKIRQQKKRNRKIIPLSYKFSQ